MSNPLIPLEQWQQNYVLPEGHCRCCKKFMRSIDYIKRRDGKGYCESCKYCINRMRYKRLQKRPKQQKIKKQKQIKNNSFEEDKKDMTQILDKISNMFK